MGRCPLSSVLSPLLGGGARTGGGEAHSTALEGALLDTIIFRFFSPQQERERGTGSQGLMRPEPPSPPPHFKEGSVRPGTWVIPARHRFLAHSPFCSDACV